MFKRMLLGIIIIDEYLVTEFTALTIEALSNN